ncbi:MAG TPA: glycosyltransferase [Dehalococcoidia bacterium]|nr:glycosyltransferase [Dehalococcoidia bacterium]
MVTRKKVMWLIKGLGIGGAERLLELALPYLDNSSFEYEVAYLLPHKNALVPSFEKAGVPVFCLNQTRSYDPRVVPHLVRLFRDRQVDLLHLHLPYTGILGRVASRLAPVKAVVYTEHNLWERYHWLTSAANRLTFGYNDAVITVSDEVKHSIQSRYNLNGKPKLCTILNGVDADQLAADSRGSHGVKPEFGIPDNHRLVVHVANFTPKKRHEDLVQAARLVIDQEPQVSFLLVGQGPLEPVIRAQVKSLNLEDNVIFAGFRTDAPRIIGAADVFVLPSMFEGLPIAMLEAMALGRPVIASRVGGVPEAIEDGVDGLLIDPMRPDQLAEKVLTVIHCHRLREKLSNNAVLKVREHFGVKRMVTSTEALYTSVLTEKGSL